MAFVPKWSRELDPKVASNTETLFLCLFCAKLCKDPVQTACAHHACRKCLSTYIRVNGPKFRCPFPCGNNLSDEPLGISPFGKWQHEAIERQCKHPTCNLKVPIRNWKDHFRNCPNQLVSCRLRGCEMEIKNGDRTNHEAEYLMRLTCCAVCRGVMTEKQRQAHELGCGDLCPQCAARVQQGSLEDHVAARCPQTMVSCDIPRCGCEMPISQRARHMTEAADHHRALSASHRQALLGVLSSLPSTHSTTSTKMLSTTLEAFGYRDPGNGHAVSVDALAFSASSSATSELFPVAGGRALGSLRVRVAGDGLVSLALDVENGQGIGSGIFHRVMLCDFNTVGRPCPVLSNVAAWRGNTTTGDHLWEEVIGFKDAIFSTNFLVGNRFWFWVEE